MQLLDTKSDFDIKNGPNNGLKIVPNPSVSALSIEQRSLHLFSAVAGHHPVASGSLGAVVGRVLLFSTTFPERIAIGSAVAGWVAADR